MIGQKWPGKSQRAALAAASPKLNAPLLAALVLALSPLAAKARHTPASYFSAADLDGNGGLSLAEYQAWMSYAFQRMDANGDGVLDPEEQLVPNAARLTLAEHHARLEKQFRRQDADGDGHLSQREFVAPPR